MPLYYAVILSLVSLSFPMISSVTRMFSTSLKNIGEETLNDIPGSNTKICGGLDLQRGASLDILQEGYGKAERLEESPRVIPRHRKGDGDQTLADVFGSSMEYWQLKDSNKCTRQTKSLSTVGMEAEERDAFAAMLKIGSNDRTKSQGDIEDVLKRRAKIYGDNLDPKWFRHDVDLGVRAKSIEDRSKARAMLAAAPLMLAQEGALEFRKRMLQGDASILSTIRLEETTTFSQVLKKLEAVPALAILKLCNKELGDFLMQSLRQQAEDLDYVQEVLDAVSNSALTPTMHAVLAGFRQRRTYGRFKNDGGSVAIDRLKFSHLASPEDHYGGSTVKRNSRTNYGASKELCRQFQRRGGCSKGAVCYFKHCCRKCGAKSHGASNCRDRGQIFEPPKNRDMSKSRDNNKRSRSMPFHSQRRRTR